MGWDPSGSVCGGSKLHELPEVGVRPIQQFAGSAGLDGGYTVGDVLIVDDEVGIGVTLISPYCRAEFCAANCLAPRDST